MDAIRKSGKTEIDQPLVAALTLWKDTRLPGHKKMEARIGTKLLEQVCKDLLR